jgi:hypothetical protein
MLIVQIPLVIAGSNAIANNSNFFGNNAGDYAANAYSNFFGPVGSSATTYIKFLW